MDVVVVREYENRFSAERAQQILENEGIESVVSVDDAGGTLPPLSLKRGCELRVRKEDLERAEELLDSFSPEEDEGNDQS